MGYLLLASRGGFAEGLRISLIILAEDETDRVIVAGSKNGKTVSDFVQDFRQAISGLTTENSVIILADTVGGSSLTTVCSVLDELGKLDDVVIFGGMNLPMAITSAAMKDMFKGDAFVQAVLPEAQVALQELKIASDDEEDDI